MTIQQTHQTQLTVTNAVELGVRTLNLLAGKELSGNAIKNKAEVIGVHLNNKLMACKDTVKEK